MAVRVKMASPAGQRAIFAVLSRDPDIARGVREAANKVRDEARQRAPVRTGDLRRSIKTQRHYDAGTRRVTYRVGWDRSIAFYGPFVELGTFHASANPHLRPAADLFGALEGIRRG